MEFAGWRQSFPDYAKKPPRPRHRVTNVRRHDAASPIRQIAPGIQSARLEGQHHFCELNN